MTAHDLLNALRFARCGPSVDGNELVLAAPAPPALVDAVELLQSGIRAAITGRRWFGIRSDGNGVGDAYGLLNPRELLPIDVAMLTVEGAGPWDKLPARISERMPKLFASRETSGRNRRSYAVA